LRSPARPEQFIEEIAEPCLEHVHLGVRDGDALGPIIPDLPVREILWRSAHATGRRGSVIQDAVRGNPESGSSGRPAARMRHPASIRQLAGSRNLSTPCSALAAAKTCRQRCWLPGRKRSGSLIVSHDRLASPCRGSGSRSRPQAAKRWRVFRDSVDGLPLVRPLRARRSCSLSEQS
jgi:hypothetical protein